MERHRFFVSCVDGIHPFYGVLVSADATVLVFADVKVVTAGSAGIQPAEGELYIDRVNIAYLQRVHHAAQ